MINTTFKTSFRNKLAVAGVLAAGAICMPGPAKAAKPDFPVQPGLKEGVMVTIPTEHADAFIRQEIRDRTTAFSYIIFGTLVLGVIGAFVVAAVAPPKPLIPIGRERKKGEII